MAQSVYRRIQTNELSMRYNTDENFNLLVCQIPALSHSYLLMILLQHSRDTLVGFAHTDVFKICRKSKTKIKLEMCKMLHGLLRESMLLHGKRALTKNATVPNTRLELIFSFSFYELFSKYLNKKKCYVL